MGFAFTASAQRGSEHSRQGSGDGGSAPAVQQNVAPAPQPQPQPQRTNPQPQNNPQPQRQPRNDNFPQRNNNNNAVSPPRNAPGNQSFTPRGGNNGYGQQRGNSYNQQRQFQPGQRPGFYAPNRPGVAPNRGGSYRSYPGLQYGRNRITARPNGFYYRNRGYYKTYYRPQLGFRINVLPFGYYPFNYGNSQYFYSDGFYYQQQNNDYTVVEPPVGAVITELPAKAQAIAINGMQYYELNGVYYQPITKDDGTLVYQIAGKDGELTTDDASAQDELPQVGDLINNLPQGYRTLKLNGQKVYVTDDGYYFQDAVDVNGDKAYKIIGTPDDEPDK